MGADKFRANVSVECDFTGGEQSEEIYDPAHSVMSTSQRTEDSTGGAMASGVPGTASALPRPTSRPAGGINRVSRTTENIAYQTSRTVKKTRMPAGVVKKMSLAVLVDQSVTWEKDQKGVRRVLVPPTPETLKIIHDLVAGVTGFNAERGDQLVIETLPFESTLLLEPPLPPGTQPFRPAVPARARPAIGPEDAGDRRGRGRGRPGARLARSPGWSAASGERRWNTPARANCRLPIPRRRARPWRRLPPQQELESHHRRA